MAIIAPLALAAWQIGSGIVNQSKAKKASAKASATRPLLPQSPFDRDMLSLAESELTYGQSAKVEQAYKETADEDYSTAVDKLIMAGGDPNEVGALFSKKQGGNLRYTMLKDQIRGINIDRLIKAQQMNEEQRQQEFQFNQWAPWADQTQAAAVAREESQKQINEGVNLAANSAMGYFFNKQKQIPETKTTTTSPGSSTPSVSGPGYRPIGQVQDISSGPDTSGSLPRLNQQNVDLTTDWSGFQQYLKNQELLNQ